MDTLVLNGDATPLSYLPLSIIPWQSAIKLLYTGRVNVIKTYTDWSVHSQHLTISVPSIIMMNEYTQHKHRVKYNRGNIYARDGYRCQLQITEQCKRLQGRVSISELTIDHVVPKSLGGSNSWANVATSCKACNWTKGSDASIRPSIAPSRPNYYALIAQRKTLPLYVRDPEWNDYLGWPSDKVVVTVNHTLVENGISVLSKI